MQRRYKPALVVGITDVEPLKSVLPAPTSSLVPPSDVLPLYIAQKLMNGV
jgi:hypothetical protein